MNEYNYKDITKITDTGIVFKDGTGLSFEECTASWNASHGLEQFLASNEYQRFAAYLKPSLKYRFNGLKIKPVK